MRIVLRLIALLAALSVVQTLWFLVMIVAPGGFRGLTPTSVLGALTFIGWIVTLIAGPITAIQLWRLRDSGRRAGVLMFGAGSAYYLGGLTIRTPEAPIGPILIAVVCFVVPLSVLLSRRAKQVTGGHSGPTAPAAT